MLIYLLSEINVNVQNAKYPDLHKMLLEQYELDNQVYERGVFVRIINPGDEKTFQTEELSINGATLVFYSVRVLNEPLDDNQLALIGQAGGFERIQSKQGYIEKVFNLNNSTNYDHMIFKSNIKTTLSPLKIDNEDCITPKINHYVTIYSRRILLVQSVLMFDKNKITKYSYITEINRSIRTNDLFAIIHAIKNKEKDYNKKLSDNVERIIDSFLSPIKKVATQTALFTYSTDKNEQCLSIQIWDIASLSLQKDEDILGIELSTRYELELSAILSCYNEHFNSNGLWKIQSANQVHQSTLSRTDVLNDHQVLLSERVCVEISQVDYPELRQISANRLLTYGYDSTSIFLWGYLVMVSAGYEVCDTKANKLHDKMLQLVTDCTKTYRDIKQITVEKQLISKQIEQYGALEKVCIEERHKHFINKGLKIRGLISIQEHAEKIFIKMKELSEVTLAADTSQTSNEISALLKEVKIMNIKQEESSSRLSILSLVLAFSAVIPLTEFIVKVIPRWDNPVGMILALFGTGLALGLISWLILRIRVK